MIKLIEALKEYSKSKKLVMKIQVAPNGELRIEIFTIGHAPHPIEGSDQEIAFAQDNDIEKCAEIALKRLLYWYTDQRQKVPDDNI